MCLNYTKVLQIALFAFFQPSYPPKKKTNKTITSRMRKVHRKILPPSVDDLMDYREKKFEKFHQEVDKIKEESFGEFDFYQNNVEDPVTDTMKFDSYGLPILPQRNR